MQRLCHCRLPVQHGAGSGYEQQGLPGSFPALKPGGLHAGGHRAAPRAAGDARVRICAHGQARACRPRILRALGAPVRQARAAGERAGAPGRPAPRRAAEAGAVGGAGAAGSRGGGCAVREVRTRGCECACADRGTSFDMAPLAFTGEMTSIPGCTPHAHAPVRTSGDGAGFEVCSNGASRPGLCPVLRVWRGGRAA